MLGDAVVHMTNLGAQMAAYPDKKLSYAVTAFVVQFSYEEQRMLLRVFNRALHITTKIRFANAVRMN